VSSGSSAPVRVRFAPSPTGALHIGGARTALYNWLFARGRGGELVLRIEDTDRERSTPENIEQILDALRWLELDWDEGPVSQYERADRHRERIQELVAADKAYYSLATSETVKAQREQTNLGFRGEPAPARAEGAAIRLRIPDGITMVHDEIRGDISFDNRVQDDLVIARADGTALYNFAVAIDDLDMGITHVVRGDDHLSNTPKQVIVMQQLDELPPRYAHLPLLHGPDGKKLSKRHGSASVQELRDAGYLPAAVRNYLALLGWGTQDDTTIMSTEELIERFDLSGVGRSSAIFDEQKLRWLNGRFMREMDLDDYTEAVARHAGREPDERLRAACAIAQEKAQTLAEVWPLIGFLFEEPETDEKAWRKVMKDGALPLLTEALETLRGADSFEPQELETALGRILAEHDVKPAKLYQPIRVAITGTSVSPGIFESLAVLGKDRSVARIERAVQRLSNQHMG
jgi:glutamyl-tRNA synthetase